MYDKKKVRHHFSWADLNLNKPSLAFEFAAAIFDVAWNICYQTYIWRGQESDGILTLLNI